MKIEKVMAVQSETAVEDWEVFYRKVIDGRAMYVTKSLIKTYHCQMGPWEGWGTTPYVAAIDLFLLMRKSEERIFKHSCLEMRDMIWILEAQVGEWKERLNPFYCELLDKKVLEELQKIGPDFKPKDLWRGDAIVTFIESGR